MIRDLSNKEKLINEFMESCRLWLSAGKPQSDVFRENRAICESLDYFLGWGGRPVFAMYDYDRCWLAVKAVKDVLKKQFMRLGLDKIYPFNHPILTGSGLKEPDDHYCLELHTGTVWDNEGRVAFVMNFKPLKETGDE